MIAVKTQIIGDVIILSLKGNLNLENMNVVEKEFSEQIAKKPKIIGIDCWGVASIDSSGLGLFMKMKKESVRNNAETVFFNITESIIALFDISKVSLYFNVMTADEFKENYLK